MDIYYNKKNICDELIETKASVKGCFYGIRGRIDLTFFQLRMPESNPYLAVRMDFNKDQTHAEGAMNDEIKFFHGEGKDKRNIIQKINARPLISEIIPFTDISTGEIQVARDFVSALLRSYESFLQTIRTDILSSLSLHVRDKASNWLNHLYRHHTSKTAMDLLGSLHWALLLDGTNCGQEFINVLEASAKNNPPKFDFVGEPIREDIKEATASLENVKSIREGILNIERQKQNIERAAYLAERDKIEAAASKRALSLLKTVCGTDAADVFNETGILLLEKNGYEFQLRSGGFIKCKDPNGKGASLCIHTRGFSCHPIDETIIAYLNIKNKFEEYMKMAIVHRADQGFKKP